MINIGEQTKSGDRTFGSAPDVSDGTLILIQELNNVRRCDLTWTWSKAVQSAEVRKRRLNATFDVHRIYC